MKSGNEKKPGTNILITTFIIVMLALISITAAAIAWFSVADQTKLSKMRLDITTGKSLRFDLDAHTLFDDYVVSLGFDDIADRILIEQGIDIRTNSMEPVTTENGIDFYYQNGERAENKDVIEFELNFMATTDMEVHLTSANSKKASDGTKIESSNADTPLAMRIAFLTEDAVYVYDPGMGEKREKIGGITYFGLNSAEKMRYNITNMLFDAYENRNVPVTVKIWVEGTDEMCSNEIKNSDFEISLRFEGTDKNGNVIE